MNGFIHNAPGYDIEKLRDVYGGGYNPGGNESDDGADDSPDPNYQCQHCRETQYIDDHMRTAPAYCEHCEAVRSHIDLDVVSE